MDYYIFIKNYTTLTSSSKKLAPYKFEAKYMAKDFAINIILNLNGSESIITSLENEVDFTKEPRKGYFMTIDNDICQTIKIYKKFASGWVTNSQKVLLMEIITVSIPIKHEPYEIIEKDEFCKKKYDDVIKIIDACANDIQKKYVETEIPVSYLEF